MKRNKKSAAVDTAAGRLQVAYWPDTEKLGQAAEAVRDKVEPYRQQVADAVGPLAHQARRSGAHYAHNALEKVTPVLDDAWEKVTPAVETARDKVQGDLLPKLNDLLSEAAEHPAAQEATKRGRATAAALRGELEVPRKRSKVRKVLTGLAIVVAVGGAAAYALRKFLDNRDAEWEAPAPSSYGPSSTPKRAEGSPWAASSDQVRGESDGPSHSRDDASPSSRDAASTGSASAQDDKTDASTGQEDTAGDGGAGDGGAGDGTPDEAPQKAAATDAGDDSTAKDGEGERRSYGAGSYVGSKPPAGFTIKGNERSMKFHTSDSPAYERTISDVWFNSEQAAEANGFSKAQR